MSIKFGADEQFKDLKSVLISKPKVSKKEDKNINPWQENYNNYNIEKAREQYKEMIEKLEQEKVEVYNLPIFQCDITQKDCRDVGLISEMGAVVATQKHKEIKKEEKEAFIKFCKDKKIPILNKNKEIRFEGGDYFPINKDKSLLGIGPRTEESAKIIGNIINSKVNLIYHDSPHHLDAVFNIISKNTIVCAKDKVEKTKWFQDKKIIELTKENQRDIVGNYILLEEGKILSCSDCPQFNKKLRKEGIDIVEVDITELKKEGGGIRCMTLPIYRK